MKLSADKDHPFYHDISVYVIGVRRKSTGENLDHIVTIDTQAGYCYQYVKIADSCRKRLLCHRLWYNDLEIVFDNKTHEVLIRDYISSDLSGGATALTFYVPTGK